MLRVAEQWYGSDVGRQRQGNEDNFFVQSPLFVVADGMGGAQAGEVASQMAVESFRGGLPSGTVEDLVVIIREANRRIHDMSRSDSQRQGMGTTCTAAYVTEEDVVLAHVGDSRAYLFRDAELTRLTRDHSLVGELVDRGKLTEEQAEVHPQRSVITRALGPESEVQVDTERIEARDGDVFLLCSDGLTSMVREHTLLPIMREDGPLAEVGKRLIAAANDAGGRDNITVVLFRIEAVEVPAGDGGPAGQQGEYTDFPTRPETREEAATAEVGALGSATDQTEAGYRADGTVALSAIRPPDPPPPPSAPPPPPPPPPPAPEPPAPPEPPTRTAPLPSSAAPEPPARKRRRRIGAAPLVFVLIGLLIIGIAAFIAIRGVFFVGLDQHRAVSIFRGVPYELPGGIDLYSRHYSSGVTIQQVPPARRATFTDHKLRSLDDASDLVRQLETGRLRG